jgi:hypothetical protein
VLLPAVSKDAGPGDAARAAMVRDARASPGLLTMRVKESISLCRAAPGHVQRRLWGLARKGRTCNHSGALFSRSPKIKLLAAIVGPSVGCGIFLGVAIMSVKGGYSSAELVSLGAVLLLAGAVFFVAIQGCKKVLKLIP